MNSEIFINDNFISEDDRRLIFCNVFLFKSHLNKSYRNGFGIFSSAEYDSNFYNQLWVRDFAFAASNYFIEFNPQIVIDSLKTILKYQKSNGEFPFRIEREYFLIKCLPLLNHLSRLIVPILEKKILNKIERPVYSGKIFFGGEDTIPAVIISFGELLANYGYSKFFIKENFNRLKLAMNFFQTKIDSSDGLAVITLPGADWADTLKRFGKLASINILWARALRLMSYMANVLGFKDDASWYREEYFKVKNSILKKLYVEGKYFKAEENDDRLDTVASIFGSLYLLKPDEAVLVEENLKSKVLRENGFQNFYPPYSKNKTSWIFRLLGQSRYHNSYVWPWVELQNIQVKIKIATKHKEEIVRDKYKYEAIKDFLRISKMFEKIGGPYEVIKADKLEIGKTLFYKPPRFFTGSMVAYLRIYFLFKKLKWLW